MKTDMKYAVAVLVDGDNASFENLEDVMGFVSRHGNAIIRRIYGDWTRKPLSGWKDAAGEHGFRLVQASSFASGKNTTDIALVIDAMDILRDGLADCFCLVASDGDYTLLAQRIREAGLLPVTEGKDNYLAELKAVRASYYYMLCDYYGNVPYLTRFDVPQGFLPEQISRKALNDSIIAEVTAALPLLPENVDESTYGRFTKWAAYALLAKMYINAEMYTGTPQWQKCLDACEEIIKSGKFSLAGNQKDVFKADNEDCTEAVFAVPFDQSYAGGLNIFNYALNGQFSQVYSTKSFGGWGGSVAVPQFINTFDPDDSRLTENYLMGQQVYPDGSNVLCEIGNSQGIPMNIVNVVPGVDWAEELHGYHLAKYEYVAGMSPGAMSNDVFPFRYTDILMMKAECLLRTGKADEAAQIVTEIRQRAFKSAPEKAVVTGAELMGGSTYDYGLRETTYLDKIKSPRTTHEGGADIKYGRFLDELGWEFNQEGRRRQDLIRFGVWTTKSWLSHSATNDINKNLYPIPRAELDKNGKLKQNPGY